MKTFGTRVIPPKDTRSATIPPPLAAVPMGDEPQKTMMPSTLRDRVIREIDPSVVATIATDQLRRKIEDMEKRYDAKLQIVFATIESMLEDEDLPKHGIGFHAPATKPK